VRDRSAKGQPAGSDVSDYKECDRNHYRCASRVKAEGLEEGLEPATPPETDDLRPLNEISKCVEPMVAALADHYRDALLLTNLQGMTQQEAAVQIGLSLSGMKSRVQRAHQQVITLWRAAEEEDLNEGNSTLNSSLAATWTHATITLR
jgi:RNA polymerase sigma-70 factor (ECF subfamily)